jgi:CitMHS family citrate-Mg2+:H+ or citrate-Ca2+:H+ symporter
MTGAALALCGFAMVAAFMTLIMTKRLTAVVALVVVPLVFAIGLGAIGSVGGFMLDGIKEVAPTAIMLMFAILFFGIMIDADLFQPLVERVVAWVGSDPLRVTLGNAALAAIVALDGDGVTTLLVCASALLPIYRRLGMNPLIFAVIGGLCSTVMNMSPWGGPAARVAVALKVNPSDLFVPLLPTIAAGLLSIFALAWMFGLAERKRLALAPAGPPGPSGAPDDTELATAFQSDPAALRPRLIWLNVALTLALMTAVVLHIAPLPVLFLIGVVFALLVNYPRLNDQRDRIMAHAGGVLSVATMVIAAGAFTGVLSGTEMVDAMAGSIVELLPPALGPYLGGITALISMPMTFFLSNDAFYFGILPVIAEAGKTYGISPAEIGRAAMLGQPIHGLSPLVAAVYLKCAVLNVELADLQRFAFKYAFIVSLVLIAAALLTGAIPLIRN